MDLQGSGRFNRRAITVGEAQRRLLDAAAPLPAETVPLWRGSGRYAAEPMAATTDWPPFARAGMDGYAVRAADIALASPELPAALRVVGAVAAGGVWAGTVEPGTAVRIMTGAAVPVGADTVVMLEMTVDVPAAAGDTQSTVLVKQPVPACRNVAPPGEEFRQGDAIVGPGELLRPGHMALLGSCGYAELRVHRRPRVAIFATGTELLPVDAPLTPGRIRDSNSALVAALVDSCGCEPLPLGRLDDEPAVVAAALAAALREADAVVTTGGVSVGDYDVVAVLLKRLREGKPLGAGDGEGKQADSLRALEAEAPAIDAGGSSVPLAASHGTQAVSPRAATADSLGTAAGGSATAPEPPGTSAGGTADVLPQGSVLFDKVAMRPGSPTSAAMIGGKPLFALSGNPGACYVGFELFVRPTLLRMQGAVQPLPEEWQVELASSVDKSSPHERFVRAKLRQADDGRLIGDPCSFAKSSMMATLPNADILLRIPAGPHGVRQGETVAAVPIRY